MSIQVIHAAFEKAIDDVVTAATDLAQTRRAVDRRISDFLGVAGAEEAEDGLRAMAELLAVTRRDFEQEDQSSQRALDEVSARIIERLG